MKISCRLSYISLSLGTENDRFMDFSINIFTMLFNILWQAFHIPLHCFASLDLHAVYLRNSELLVSIYRWQEYINSLCVLAIDIMKTVELHAYNLYIFNYALSVKKKRERMRTITINLCEFHLPSYSLNLYPIMGMRWEVRRNFSHSNLSFHMPLRELALKF